MARYVVAIKKCQSIFDLAAAMGVQVGPARAYIRKRWDDLPADSRPQWLADAILPASKQEAGKMGGKTRPYKMIARSEPLRGAPQVDGERSKPWRMDSGAALASGKL